MKTIKVSDVMTTPAISIGPDTPFKRIAQVLAENAISAVPVVDAEQHVVGIVSEADLLPRIGHVTMKTGYPLEGRAHRHEAEKAAAILARDLMSEPATRLVGDATLAQAARLFYQRGVRRLPVVDWQGRLQGMLSRRDLLRPFLRSDEEIEAEVKSINPCPAVDVSVHDGVVYLTGHAQLLSEVEHLRAHAAETTGVLDVESGVTFDVDDYATSLPYRLMTT